MNRPHDVGTKKPHPWGLYDMAGNVWQWCEDYYGPYNDDLKSPDPLRSVKHSQERRVLRGGSWTDFAAWCRAAHRYHEVAPGRHFFNVGFRVAFDAMPESK